MTTQQKMNTFVETTLAECESIISETENVEEYSTGDMLDVIQFYDIRESAEEMQTLVVAMSENEFVSNNMLENIENQSITIYQNIKYILETAEDEIFSSSDTEVMKSFDNMRTYVNSIRNIVDTFVLEWKV